MQNHEITLELIKSNPDIDRKILFQRRNYKHTSQIDADIKKLVSLGLLDLEKYPNLKSRKDKNLKKEKKEKKEKNDKNDLNLNYVSFYDRHNSSSYSFPIIRDLEQYSKDLIKDYPDEFDDFKKDLFDFLCNCFFKKKEWE